jgi:PKD repeat protein
MEYTKNYPFATGAATYPVLTAPATYSVSVTVIGIPGADANIQKVTVGVLKDGVNVLTISDYKVNR